ncbi:MAG: glycosyltransferase family 2 protein [Candidatus Pacearchaeota archaeon]|nr:glycosyltransferase family 2 protein [Candidatus Pacearchaeota archaeon]
MNILVPMAGRGSRFLKESHNNPEYAKPKPTINVKGHPMVRWALASLPLTEKDQLIFLVLKEHVENFRIDETLKKTFGDKIKIIVVDKLTEGAACTALLAKEYINNEEPLLVTDSDHYLDGAKIFNVLEKYKDLDGLIPVFYANNSKWSFSKIDEEEYVIEVAEKLKISRNANIGAYYFGKGRDFVWAAEEMIEENDRTNEEFFMAPVYNYMIRRGKLIRLVRPRFAHGLGTPKDLEKFLVFLERGEVKYNFDNLDKIKEAQNKQEKSFSRDNFSEKEFDNK